MDTEDQLLEKVRQLEEKIAKLELELTHDSLTALKTRKFFEEKSRNYLSLASNDSEKRNIALSLSDFSLIFFDIDYFKKINDTYGHVVGDETLKEVAKVISESVRSGDVAARWGGEEIAVFLLGSNERNAKSKAEEIRRAIENLKFANTPDLKVTISAGVASFDDNSTNKEVLDRADKALYKAKETGRNKVVTYSEINA